MRAASLRGPLLGLLLPTLQACVAGSPEGSQSAREPVRWILVERRYGDIADAEAAGDGRINPDAVVLAFQPLYPEDLTWEVVVSPEEHFAELVEVSPSGPVAPGEIVTATIRVGRAKPGQRYRLSARPSEKGIQIVGQEAAVVEGPRTASFRFTSPLAGRAGIAVAVERLSELDARQPE